MRFLGFLIAPAILLTGACSSETTPTAETTEPIAPAAAQSAELDPNATAVWAYLQTQDFQQNWQMWPGKQAFYEGGQPHGMLLTTYLNGVALEALNNQAGEMPVGAIIVKENYMPNRTLAATTVMYKTSGFNPEHNNWYFLKRNADGTVDADGMADGCQGCHGAGLGATNDYILTESLSE